MNSEDNSDDDVGLKSQDGSHVAECTCIKGIDTAVFDACMYTVCTYMYMYTTINNIRYRHVKYNTPFE